MPTPHGIRKIAILGGGCGSLAAAFALTNQRDWQNRYDITIYQMGWRLGGKGASGRNSDSDGMQRIEEHGLHVWAGFYHHAFKMIRRCYHELKRPQGTPLRTWDQAFKPQHFVTLQEQWNGQWLPWHVTYPPTLGSPGVGPEIQPLWQVLLLILQWSARSFRDATFVEFDPPPLLAPEAAGLPEWIAALVSKVFQQTSAMVATAAGNPSRAQAASPENAWMSYLDFACAVAKSMPTDPREHSTAHHEALSYLFEHFNQGLSREGATTYKGHHTVRRMGYIFDILGTCVKGILKDRLFLDGWNGFDKIDHLEIKAWLRHHGAQQSSVDSVILRSGYDYVFGYVDGDPTRPAQAAGTTLRAFLRLMFTYKGALFWEMQAGMGDVVFAPLYQVLKARGVKFRFFHRIDRLELSSDRTRIERIHIGRQVDLKTTEYSPLISVKRLPCWPAHPDFEQIQNGDELRKKSIDLESAWPTGWPDVASITLEADRDFDLVVLGISLGAFPKICADIIKVDSRWRDMVDQVKTVRTLALQLWLKKTVQELGWRERKTILTAYAQPLNTWADFSHLIDREDWPAHLRPGSIAYFCGPMTEGNPPDDFTDPTVPAQARTRIKQQALTWLATHMAHLWPHGAPSPGHPGLNYEELVDPRSGVGVERFDRQYWRANINPSDRYVQHVPGSLAYRMYADGSGYQNLFLAGDWVRTGLNAGCVEAAVMAGLQAAEAIKR